MRSSFLISCLSPALQYPALLFSPVVSTTIATLPPPLPLPLLVLFHLLLWLWLQSAFSQSASEQGVNV